MNTDTLSNSLLLIDVPFGNFVFAKVKEVQKMNPWSMGWGEENKETKGIEKRK